MPIQNQPASLHRFRTKEHSMALGQGALSFYYVVQQQTQQAACNSF